MIDRWELFLMLVGAFTLAWAAADVFFLLAIGACNLFSWLRHYDRKVNN